MNFTFNLDELKMYSQSIHNKDIISDLSKIIKSTQDFNYDPESKIFRLFQLMYFYHKIFTKILSNFGNYIHEVQLYNSHLDKLDSSERYSISNQYLDEFTFNWMTQLNFSNITDKTYSHMIEYIKYFNPKLIENDTPETTPDAKTPVQKHTVKKPPTKKPMAKKSAAKTTKPTKKKIPATVRNAVWNKSNGAKNKEGTCDVCNEITTFASFHCGHIVAEANGGEVSLTNLKAICGLCNSSMGTMNMDEFIKKYKFDEVNKDNTNQSDSVELYFEHIERDGKYYLTESGYTKYFNSKLKKELVQYLCDNFKDIEFDNKEDLLCKK